jgi:hypothetical protein
VTRERDITPLDIFAHPKPRTGSFLIHAAAHGRTVALSRGSAQSLSEPLTGETTRKFSRTREIVRERQAKCPGLTTAAHRLALATCLLQRDATRQIHWRVPRALIGERLRRSACQAARPADVGAHTQESRAARPRRWHRFDDYLSAVDPLRPASRGTEKSHQRGILRGAMGVRVVCESRGA